MKEAVLNFYVNKYNFLKDTNSLDLSFLPPILRRRMSTLDKITLSLLNQTYSDDVQNIVFSSQYGEVERLIKLISQYLEDKEVSPNAFSGSVHNYSSGFFLLNKQNPLPYSALASCENSISMGLLSSVISNYDNILFCYADFYDNNANALAINLTKQKKSQSDEYIISLENNTNIKDNFNNFINLFDKNINSLKTSNYTIERVTE